MSFDKGASGASGTDRLLSISLGGEDIKLAHWQLAQLEKAQHTNPHIAGVVEQLERTFMKRQKLFAI